MTELEKKLSEQNEQLTRIISTLTQTIDDLNRTIAELQEQLNKNVRGRKGNCSQAHEGKV